MAVIKDPTNTENTVNYIATLAFFCCISCITLMLKFGGFKASLNFNGKKKTKEHNEHSVVSISGAYRTNRDEFFGYTQYQEPQRKLTPSVGPISPTERIDPPLRTVKSTNDLTKNKNLPANLRQSNPNISQDPRGAEHSDTRNNGKQETRRDKERLDAEKKVDKQRQSELKKLEKQRLEEQKKLEKQRAEEQKKRDRLTAQEHARQEKLRKEQEKRVAQQAKKEKKNKKGPAPKPLANPLAQAKPQHSTNTLESSISRTSGPPPYNDVPKPDLVKNEGDSSGNVSFSKPIDEGSWDLITQHREQINRPVVSTPDRKQMVLKYNADLSDIRENSEA